MKVIAAIAALLVLLPAQPGRAQTYAGFHLGEWSVVGTTSVGNPTVVADDRFVVMAGGDIGGDLLLGGPLHSNAVSIGVVDQAGVRWVAGGTLPHGGGIPFSMFMHGGAVYVISRGIVHRGAIDAAGSLAPWQIVGNLGGEVAPQAAVAQGHVYFFGIDGARAVGSARLLQSGLGPLQPAGVMPATAFPRYLFATRTHVYLFTAAGNDLTAAYSTDVAEARPDGTLGLWRPAANPPHGPVLAAAQLGEYLYAFGHWGRSPGVDHKAVQRARILLDGSLVEWELQLPPSRQFPLPVNHDVDSYSYRSAVVTGRYALWFGGTRRWGSYLQSVDVQVLRSAIGAPVVRTQSPDPVPTVGAPLIVEGFNFVPATRVFVNDAELTPTTIAPTSIVVNVPAGGEGQARLRIANPDGESATVPFRYAVRPSLPSASPRALTASVGAFSSGASLVTLTWQPAEGAAALGYLVEAGYTSGATSFAAHVGHSLSFMAAAPAGRYHVRVRALLAFGESATSNEVVVFVDGGAGMAPRHLAWSLSPNRTVTLTWDAAGRIGTNYLLEVGTSAGTVDVGSFPITGTSVAVAGAPPGTYYVRVRGADGEGLTAPSNEIIVVVR